MAWFASVMGQMARLMVHQVPAGPPPSAACPGRLRCAPHARLVPRGAAAASNAGIVHAWPQQKEGSEALALNPLSTACDLCDFGKVTSTPLSLKLLICKVGGTEAYLLGGGEGQMG